MINILVLEDDEMLNAGLCYNLQAEGWQPYGAFTIKEGIKIWKEVPLHLAILDVNLPDGTGFDLGKKIREEGKIPIVYLTANDTDEDMITGFENGGDDYITKPFNIKVVIHRLQALLRRCKATGAEAESCGNLEIDFDTQRVKKSGENLELTPTEFKLLHKFIKNKGQVLTRQMLLGDLWDAQGNFVDEHTLTINISRLRSKIADGRYSYIKTVYGVGYLWIGEKNE